MSADALFDAGPATAPKALDPTIAARVPATLKAKVLAAARGGNVDASVVIREALDAYLTPGARGPSRSAAIAAGILRGGQGAARRNATATERAAALAVAPRVGSQRFRALTCFAYAGAKGLTADEVVVKLAPAPHNGVARRVTDLLQGGLITERTADTAAERAELGAHDDRLVDDHSRDATPVVRTTRAGAHAQVYIITPAGHRALEAAKARA